MLLLALGELGIALLEKVGEDVADKLQGDVLERPRRAVPQLKDVLVVTGLAQRRDLGVTEGRVRAVNDVLEVGRRDRVGRDEERQDLVGQLGEREVGPLRLPVGGELGDLSRDVETSIGSETGQDGLEVVSESSSRPGNERVGCVATSAAVLTRSTHAGELTSSNVSISAPPRVEKYLVCDILKIVGNVTASPKTDESRLAARRRASDIALPLLPAVDFCSADSKRRAGGSF